MSTDFVKFIQFTKLEDTDDGPIIWGVATHQQPDLDNEVCMYADAVPVYQAWCDAAMARTAKAGQEESLGNIRLQHGLDIGGKATKLDFDDENKAVMLGSKPLNDQIHADLKAGFYTGYSQGGSYAYRKCSDCDRNLTLQQANNWCPTCKKNVVVNYGLKRLSEVSYVDSPCSGVGFEHVKTDGSRVAIKFSKRGDEMANEPTPEFISKVAAALRKGEEKTKRVAGEDLPHENFAYVGDPEKTDTWKLPIKFSTDAKTKRHIRNALARFEQTKGIPADKKDDVKAKIHAAAKEHGIDVQEESDKAATAHDAVVAKMKARIEGVFGADVTKGLYEVSRLAELLQGLAYMYESALWERDMEGDESTVPEELQDILESLIDTFVAMAEEEAKELAARSSGKSAKGETPMTQEELDALNKAAKKTLASHFAKNAVHHEKMAAAHDKAAESHNTMCDAAKAAHGECKSAKADVESGQEPKNTAVASGDYYKAAGAHHAEKAKFHEKCAKAHESMAEHCHKMADDHDKEEHEKTVKALKEAADPAPVAKAAPTIEQEVAAAVEAERNSPEHQNAVKAIAKKRLDAELATSNAEIEAALAKLKETTIAPDGVRLVTKTGAAVTVVPRDGEGEQFTFAKLGTPVSEAGI
jgi:hypothetical protein